MHEIRNHLLVGDNVEIAETGTKRGPVIPRFLVMHYTAGRNAESSVRHFQNPAAGASAHLVIGRNGRIWQLVPFNLKAWHAGISSWPGSTDSIPTPSESSSTTRADSRRWATNTRRGLAQSTRRARSYVPATRMSSKTSHIAPGRKTDPGPLFDWDRYARQAGLPADWLP